MNPYQISYNGLTMGPGTAVEFQKIEGLDMPQVRSGDAARARDHGLFIGLDALGGREVTVTADLASDGSSFQHAWAALAGATVPGGTTEQPLYVNLPGFGTMATMARMRRRQMPIDIRFALGNLANVTLQWGSTDPRLYLTPTQQASVQSPQKAALGFSFPLSFPFTFGGGSVAGALQVTNTGNIETRPILTITGPCQNPSVMNSSVTGLPQVKFTLTMAAGDKLVLDADLHTATYYVSGSSQGASRYSSLVRGSTWWTLQPGVNNLQFLSDDGNGTGTLSVQYASAYIL